MLMLKVKIMRAHGTNLTIPKDRGGFRREPLPMPEDYFRTQRLMLTGGGKWRSALCPIHGDSRRSLRGRLDTGAFRRMACSTHGGGVLALHVLRTGLHFVDTAKALSAWGNT